ncbi:Ubiquitin carboxyl-terminal hydrolase 14 [Leucoagaricus sp. SymC.cos]|nr:Ubiquitin carboxyl-terminal hydrolase 14 [Leucoagaricus sp. SymC.cos]
MACAHLDQLRNIKPPSVQLVHREECTLCFDGQDSPTGVDVCLICFNGGCLDPKGKHSILHFLKFHHPFTLNVKRKLKSNAQRVEDEEPPAKMKKLAIVEEREEDKYEHVLTIRCWLCEPAGGKVVPDALQDPQIKTISDGVMSSLSSARQSEVKAWEEEIIPCEHTLMLQQETAGPIPESGLAHCRLCDLKENLWLCLTCGSLGCGRQLHGGLGGNGHGLQHFNESRHPVSVKLGTITPEGSADIYCYVCDDAKQDPEIAAHLASFGINVQTLSKTEKTMTELQLEHNLTYDFSLTTEDGTALEPLFGPGLTGLQNLGNSCYMASVLQTLFSLEPFKERYNTSDATVHQLTCDKLPADCLECQMYKIADGLLSGKYSVPNGIRPVTFKSVIGRGHAEFSTMRQQDAEEFFTHLMQTLRRDIHKFKSQGADVDDPTAIFSFAWEQRLQCTDCKKVRYVTEDADVVSVSVPATEKGKTEDGKVIYDDVELTKCLDALLGVEALEYACPGCKKTVHALKQTKFSTFPETLVVHAKKFQLVNWVPAKLDIPLILPPGDILEYTEMHLGKGLQPGEEELGEAPPPEPQFDSIALEQLLLMGFSENRCKRALLATNNSGLDMALAWIFEHTEDPDIDAPIQALGASGGGAGDKPKPEPPVELVTMLSEMGFTDMQAKKALRQCDNNMERAVEWLFSHPDNDGSEIPPTSTSAPSSSSPTKTLPGTKEVPIRYRLRAFISHKGPSVYSGHYVAHIRKGNSGVGEAEGEWVLFNDEKVVRADDESVRELKKLAYLYVFEKV